MFMNYKEKQTSLKSRTVGIGIATVIIVISIFLTVFFLLGAAKHPAVSKDKPMVVIRVDDIQDYAFHEAQLFLLEDSVKNNIPLSLAVIPGMFGQDKEVVEATKLAINLKSEVTAHGWKHEDLSALSSEMQAELLRQARSRINLILNYDTRVLVVPMYKFNQETIAAMSETDYDIISSFIDQTEPGLFSKIKSIPGTVNLSSYSANVGNSWNMKSVDSTKDEIATSVKKYRYAVVVTHPQEFLTNGELNPANKDTYQALTAFLKESYHLGTLSQLGTNQK
jgi:peptidoglycan/xylan/chitin deacetylase (PgdA/CDA1 family)